MTTTAVVIADSVGPRHPRITTLQLRYPRFIHAEFMTHRVFSRNASSSRAIPVSRMINTVMMDPVIPSYWGANQAGMQAREECNNEILLHREGNVDREHAWLYARDHAIAVALAFEKAGYHKQIVNRLLEPWGHINVIVTSTDYQNFFELRRHRDAQPEIQELANAMYEAMQHSEPTFLQPGQWHMPYVVEDNLRTEHLYLNTALACSVARCARVSYLTHDMKKPEWKEDFNLFTKLMDSHPIHASPAEHQATPDTFDPLSYEPVWNHPILHANFKGWCQYRQVLAHKHVPVPHFNF